MHAAVLGEDAVDRGVGQHDELVHPRRERPQLRDRRSEHGARRVDLLRDDDEPHECAAIARSTSSATRSAYSSAVYVQSAERA